MNIRLLGSALLVAFLLGLSGCGDGFQVVPFSGQVTAEDGTPLDKIFVEFYPVAGGAKSFGETDAQGVFVLKTVDGRDGAVVGEHHVTLRDTAVLGDKFMGRAAEHVNMSEGRKPRIANKYISADQSGIKCTVSSDGQPPVFKTSTN